MATKKTTHDDFKSSGDNVKVALTKIHNVLMTSVSCCGLPMPNALKGISVGDLGCGTGRDVYLLSQLVGPNGFALGVDTTDEQLNVAREYVDYHTKAYGYNKPNVDFRQGYIERLHELELPGRFDLIVSNCSITLSMDKKAVMKGAYELLKVGGEVYFSDHYSSIAIPEPRRNDKKFWGRCISGSLCWKELINICEEIGFSKPAIYDSKYVSIDHLDIEKPLKDANLRFAAITYRFFKLDRSNTSRMAATYKGTIPGEESEFKFSEGLKFPVSKAINVSPELGQILSQSRYKQHFTMSPSTIEEAQIEKLDPFTVCNIPAKKCS